MCSCLSGGRGRVLVPLGREGACAHASQESRCNVHFTQIHISMRWRSGEEKCCHVVGLVFVCVGGRVETDEQAAMHGYCVLDDIAMVTVISTKVARGYRHVEGV